MSDNVEISRIDKKLRIISGYEIEDEQ